MNPETAKRLARRFAVALPVGLAAAAAAHWWRGYPWLLAAVTGLAIGGLLFVTWRTVDRMRDLQRR
jgi:hypothetical protein